LRLLGRAKQIVKKRQLLIRSERLPKLYSKVVTRDRGIVGKVTDIIGPVMDPHVVVTLTEEAKKDEEKIIGEELFELEEGNKWRRRR